MDSSKWKQGRDNSISMSFLLIEWIDFSYWTRCVTGSEYSTRQNSLSVHLELTFYSSKVLHRNSREREREETRSGWICWSLAIYVSYRWIQNGIGSHHSSHKKRTFLPSLFFGGGGWVIVSPLWYAPLFQIASVFDGAKRHARHPCVSWFPCRYMYNPRV